MTDDRFEDLGGEQRRAEIGERLAERDRTHPEQARRPEVPRPGNKYAWAVGIVMVMGLGVLLFLQTLPNEGKGFEGPRRGSIMKAFAAPSALGHVEGDANVCQRQSQCTEQTGTRPACTLRSEEVVNVCELRRRPLVLTFIFDRGADCYPQVDRTERVRPDLPGVNFATVFFTHKDRDQVRALVRERGWRQPVGIDPDGAVANLYGVGGCPTTVFASAGGRVVTTKLGNLTEDELRRRAQRLAS
ncbi:MAG: TlpA family protein disulfide reductase [Thermoleophilaceae bacterium]|nr:TlpA family protein disulfide reductase [Thermoleophilaceae bacterium]